MPLPLCLGVCRSYFALAARFRRRASLNGNAPVYAAGRPHARNVARLVCLSSYGAYRCHSHCAWVLTGIRCTRWTGPYDRKVLLREWTSAVIPIKNISLNVRTWTITVSLYVYRCDFIAHCLGCMTNGTSPAEQLKESLTHIL